MLRVTTASQSYSSGQPVWPAFEGWEKNDDGSFNFVFGYMNDNWREELDVPIGPDNNIEPGGPDHGQPTHFQPRRNRFMFRVRVPKDLGDKEMVWTLTTQGDARRRPTRRCEPTCSSRTSTSCRKPARSAPAPAIRSFAPTSRRSSPSSDAKIAQRKSRRSRSTLTATVTDDGVPRARRRLAAGHAA